MTEGDVALTALPQADGRTKPRPAILLRQMPPFGDWLVCGVSTQLHHEAVGFDETIGPSHSDFRSSGLKALSLIRLGYLVVLPADRLLGILGSISSERATGVCSSGSAPFSNRHGADRAKTESPRSDAEEFAFLK